MVMDNSEAQLNSISSTKLVAVEGKDEVNLLRALRDKLKINDFEFKDVGGKYSFATRLKALINTTGFQSVVSLGIIRDADSDAENTFAGVCNALKEVGLPIPTKTLEIANNVSSTLKVVILILPNGMSQGMLEDVCLQSIENDPAMKCVDDYFNCLKTNVGRLPGNLSKARVHAFLSSRDDCELRLGEAACAGYWPMDDKAFDPIKQFLLML